eukprot:Nitzschia sp. Nitz4//scaffold8_size234185//93733//94832//NITZ4_001255-RA/size234185-snap-gene-0.14-mRNA-1//1//CDS//3329559800//5904//frame0
MPTLTKPKPSVAVIGSGAIGSYYGARLCQTGKYDVKFLMRGDHRDACIANGLEVTDPNGGFSIPPDGMEVFSDVSEMGKVDWVIVAFKSSSLPMIAPLVYPLLEPGRTRVCIIMNGLVEDDIIGTLKKEAGESTDDPYLQCCQAIYGGIAFVCVNRVAPGRIDNLYDVSLNIGLAAKSKETTEEENKQVLQYFWSPTAVPVNYEDSLLRARWKKNIWNIPFNGLSVTMGGITVDKILVDPGLTDLSGRIMDEVIATANADLDRHGHDSSMHLGPADRELMFRLCEGAGEYRTSTAIDLLEKRPMEAKYLFRRPVEIAKEVGISVPHLESLTIEIEALQRLHNLY